MIGCPSPEFVCEAVTFFVSGIKSDIDFPAKHEVNRDFRPLSARHSA
jgi:hypothetical protein